MPGQSLLDIDPDKLFETRTVAEIEEIQKIINSEIEKKKEDLRTLVGERYRDLIEAADTIKKMKELSTHIIQDVDKMNSEMLSLQKKHQSYNTDNQFKERQSSFCILDSIASQISILVELPELIWTSINNKDYVRATHLYLLGRHIKTGFSVDKSLLEYSRRLPVVDHQWSTLSHFSTTILKAAEKDLKQINLTDEEASMCLATIAILQDTSLTSKFLSLRTDAIDSLLFCDNNVKSRILNSCASIINSLSLLNACILAPWEMGKGLVWKHLLRTTDNHHPVNLLEENIKLRFLPTIVLHFKVIPLSKNDKLDMDSLEKEVSEWLNEIKQIVSVKGKALLNNVNSLHGLNSITSEYKKSDSEWEQLLSTFNIKNKFDVWDGIYKPLITSRAKELISLQCEETFRDVVRHIEKSITEDMKRSDLDLRWFVWKDAADDLEIPSNKSAKGICLKSKAITPKVYSICNAFEQKLNALYQDLSGLYSTEDILDSDGNELKNHQQAVCSVMIERLIKYVHDLVDKDGINEGNVSILARFLQAVPDICPMLQKCLMLGENKENAWQTIKLLNSESLYCWSVWEKKALNRIQKYIPELIKVPKNYADLLNIIPQWDMIWIEEGDETEINKHKSQFRVPATPSLPLQAVLQQIMTEVGRAHIPRLIIENLMQKIVPVLLNCYNASTPLCQSHSLQSLFDVKYISSQFIPLTNKDLNLICQDKISQIEKNIDPIDLEVFSPQIRINIKSAILKTQGMYGLTFRSEDTAGIKMSDDACILALSKSTNNIWFPLLSLTNPSNRLLHSAKSKTIKVDKQLTEGETTKIQSATSFFSDWFS